MSKKTKLIVRTRTDGSIGIRLRRDNGEEISILGVAKVHFIRGAAPEIVVTLRADEIDAEVEISAEMTDDIERRNRAIGGGQ